MNPTSTTEAHHSLAPDGLVEPSLIPDGPVASTRADTRPVDASTTRPAAPRSPLARLLAALRGDKYMVDAYPPTVSLPKDS
jgi:hypothetical protein